MLSREEVLKIANLARLELTDEEVQIYQKKMDRVLEYVHELQSIPTQDLASETKKELSFRADEAHIFENIDGILKNAPALEEKSFHLPKVVEHSGG